VKWLKCGEVHFLLIITQPKPAFSAQTNYVYYALLMQMQGTIIRCMDSMVAGLKAVLPQQTSDS